MKATKARVLPCPHCGEQPIMEHFVSKISGKIVYLLACEDCYISSDRKESEAEAVQDWNSKVKQLLDQEEGLENGES